MKLLLFPLIFVFSLAQSQSFKKVNFDEVEFILNTENDTTYLINFWATWCKPCIEEMPYFEELTSIYTGNKFKVILISLDFKSDVETRLKPFLIKKKLISKVWWLDEPNQNKFIEKVEQEWYGEIPFTLIKNGKLQKRYWKAGKFEKQELLEKVKEFL